jgi:hypothetical protein
MAMDGLLPMNIDRNESAKVALGTKTKLLVSLSPNTAIAGSFLELLAPNFVC